MSLKTFYAAAVAVALIAGTPALAKSQNQPSAEGASASAKKGPRKICKNFNPTGSRLNAEKLCLTRAEWKKFDAAQ